MGKLNQLYILTSSFCAAQPAQYISAATLYHLLLVWQDTQSLMAMDMVEHLKKGIGYEGQVFSILF